MPSCRRRWRASVPCAAPRWCPATVPTDASSPARAGRIASSPSRSRSGSPVPIAARARWSSAGREGARRSTDAPATPIARSRSGTSRAWCRVPIAGPRSWSRRKRARPARFSAASSARGSLLRNRSVRDALEHFLTELAGQRRASAHTLAAYRRDIARVLDLAAGPAAGAAHRPVPASAWARELLERALRDLHRTGHAAASAARALAAWRSFSRFCVRRGIIASNPARELPVPRVPARRPRTLPSVDLARALDRLAGADAASLRDRALLELAYSAGLRLSELVGLNRGDVDRAGGLLRVRGKGRRERIVPAGAGAFAALDRYL